MKFIKIAAFSLIFSASGALAEESPQSVIEHYMAAWNAHSASQASRYLANDVIYYDAATGSPVKGKEKAEKEVIGAFIQAVPDLKWKMTSQPVFNNDTIAFQWEFSGTNAGEWAGSPATHNKIKFEGVSFIKVNEGKITYQGDYYDSKKLDAELAAAN
ncbi:ester cyclase [Pantoea brenneri]|uniref:ester cyclase n=1 Tax=Pantoea brenneri TaxID=472694 RepID=UPI00289B3E80|nr:ester cyclase [Pantoea brenneri]